MTLKLTSAELRELLDKDPDWIGKHATEENPVTITNFCTLNQSNLRSLSPHITFAGRNHAGRCALLSNCEFLKKAEGKFEGSVCFEASGIEEIGELEITQADNAGDAANFHLCLIKTARGKFNGRVDFSQSRVEEIDAENLILTASPNSNRACADFFGCVHLKTAEGTYPNGADFSFTGIQNVKNLQVNAGNVSFKGCENLHHLSGTFPGIVDISESSIKRVERFQAKELHAFKCDELTHCPWDILGSNADENTLRRLTRTAENEKKARKTLKTDDIQL